MSTVIDQKDLEWLVDSRSKIQRFLLKLHSFAKEIASGDDLQARQFQILMAVGFALWRAAFLAQSKRPLQNIHCAAIDFLETLIQDNAIGYAQDKKHKEWTFGYYLNDAYFRLAYFHQELHLKESHAKRVTAFLDEQTKKRENEPDYQVAWDHAYEAAVDAFKTISRKRSLTPCEATKESRDRAT